MVLNIPERCNDTFRQALQALNESRVPNAIGGAFAIFHYTGMWRNTHDLDIYLEHKHLTDAVSALLSAGFEDKGEVAPGDNTWILHAIKNDTLVDLIWEPPNHLRTVDTPMIAGGDDGEFLGVPVRFLSADELIWSKVFTLNRHRCDWPDIWHVIRARPSNLDWSNLLEHMGEQWPVLTSCIIMFDWTFPQDREAIPNGIRDDLKRLHRERSNAEPEYQLEREELLDPWLYTRTCVE
jgi:hypothetical protein